MKFNIDNTSVESIQHSFDNIAKELILEWDLKVNDHLFSFTEIEFYYYDESIHKDMS